MDTGEQRDSETGSGSAADSPEPSRLPALPLDKTFELLRNQRRRYVLQYLEGTTDQVSLSDLAEQIAAWENDKEIRQITSSERKRVYVGLYQCHLPKMDGMGVISFNKPRGLIERGENADQVEPYLHGAAVADGSSLTGRVGLFVIGLTMLPAVILLLSQAMVPLVLAATVVAVASLGGVMMVLRSSVDGDVARNEATVA